MSFTYFLNTLFDATRGNTFLLTIGLVILFFVLIAVALYVYIFIHGKQLQNKVKLELNTENALVINLKDRKVKIINFKTLDELDNISYEDFVKRFYAKDSENFDKRATNLISGQVLADSEDTVKLFNYSKTKDLTRKDILKYTHKLMLCCMKINKKEKIIYLNAHFLFNLPVDESVETETMVKDVYSIKEINHQYALNKFKYGAMYFIKFYKNNNVPSSYNEYELRYLILNNIYRKYNNLKAKKHLVYYVFSDSEALELVMIRCRNSDISLTSKNISTIGKITNDLKRKIKSIDYLLEIKGLNAFYDYTITAGQINKLDKDFIKSVRILKSLNSLAKEGQHKYLVYNEEYGNNQNIEDSYKAEVAKIIRLNLLNINFLPIFRIANVRVMTPAYIAVIEPKMSIFKTLDEVKTNAVKYNLNKELYSLIVRDVVPVFNDEKENITTKLAYFISFNEIEFMVRNFPHMSGIDNLNLILVLNNNDLISIDNDKDSDALREQFKNHINLLKDRGYEIYLNINVGDYILREKTYTGFDGFFINSNLPANFKVDHKIVQDAYALYNKMAKFNKPIVSYQAQSWQEIELLVKKGIYTFATKVLSEPSSVLIPIKKKVSKKLSNMYKK